MKLTCRDCDKYLECKFNGRKGSSQICKDFTNNFKMIRELEKIKEEIQKYVTENKNSDDLYLAGCGDGAYHTLATINKRIAELKGE